MIDLATVQTVAGYIGLAGAAFLGGMKGGVKANRELRADVDEIKQFLVDRFGMPQKPKPKNGKTADLGLAEGVTAGADSRPVDRRS